MTSGQDTERGRRRELVTLSVIAGSAISLAATWAGIAAVDGAQPESAAASVPVSAPATAATAIAATAATTTSNGATAAPTPTAASVQAPSGTLLVPVPSQSQQAPTQPVRPVRRSRAS